MIGIFNDFGSINIGQCSVGKFFIGFNFFTYKWVLACGAFLSSYRHQITVIKFAQYHFVIAIGIKVVAINMQWFFFGWVEFIIASNISNKLVYIVIIVNILFKTGIPPVFCI